jgi:serine phosphatase RsbU (regulator of sigma subunit)
MMDTTTFILSLAGSFLIGMALFFGARINGQKKLKHEQRRRQSLRQQMKREEEEHKSEIRRLNYVLDRYRKKQEAEFPAAKTKSPANGQAENPSVDDLLEEAGQYEEGDVRSIAHLKAALESERDQFQQKNQQLWNQSIAIHQEKERIDVLKGEIESRHRAVTDSILYARRIQDALLPEPEALREALPAHGLIWRPRDIVSGDFYWIKQIGQKVVIMVADCTGHGVPGAFMSMLGVAFLNEIVTEGADLQPHLILEALRHKIKTSLRQQGREGDSQDGMDAVLCVWDREAGQVHFSGAKNPLFHLREGELKVYKGSPNPVGYYPREKPFRSQTLEANPGDTFYAFSDGFIDQFGGPEGKRYRSPRFRELIGNSAAAHPDMNAQAAAWDASLQQWMGEDYEQLDDILLLGFRVPED